MHGRAYCQQVKLAKTYIYYTPKFPIKKLACLKKIGNFGKISRIVVKD